MVYSFRGLNLLIYETGFRGLNLLIYETEKLK